MKLETAIKNTKAKLIAKVQKKGIYENFGQTEVRKLKDKFNYINLCYGSDSERKQADLIMAFDKWCMHYNG